MVTILLLEDPWSTCAPFPSSHDWPHRTTRCLPPAVHPTSQPRGTCSSQMPRLTFLLWEAIAIGWNGAGCPAGGVGVLVLAAGGQCAGGEGAGAGEEHIAGQAWLQAGRAGKAGLPAPTAQALIRQCPLQALLGGLQPRQVGQGIGMLGCGSCPWGFLASSYSPSVHFCTLTGHSTRLSPHRLPSSDCGPWLLIQL